MSVDVANYSPSTRHSHDEAFQKRATMLQSSDGPSHLAVIRRARDYAAAAGLVAGATAASAMIAAQVPQAEVSLVFMLPVVGAALLWGWGPSLTAAALGVAAFDFFFTEPRFSFRVDQTSQITTLILLSIVAAIASTSAARARRSALQAQDAARRAHALHELARATIRGADETSLLQLSRTLLEDCFGVKAVVLKVGEGGSVEAVGGAEAVGLSSDDQEAALWTVNHGRPSRAATYPFFGSRFDLWPIPARRVAFGLKFQLSNSGRPDHLDEMIELVSGYVVGAHRPESSRWRGAGRAMRLQRSAPLRGGTSVGDESASLWEGSGIG